MLLVSIEYLQKYMAISAKRWNATSVVRLIRISMNKKILTNFLLFSPIKFQKSTHLHVNIRTSMSLVSHKKSYLVCVKLTNFSNIHATYSYFFSKYKTETAKTGQRQLLENKEILHNISKIGNFVTYQITFLMTCQQHKSMKSVEQN